MGGIALLSPKLELLHLLTRHGSWRHVTRRYPQSPAICRHSFPFLAEVPRVIPSSSGVLRLYPCPLIASLPHLILHSDTYPCLFIPS
jgi:hypothetical protein